MRVCNLYYLYITRVKFTQIGKIPLLIYSRIEIPDIEYLVWRLKAYRRSVKFSLGC